MFNNPVFNNPGYSSGTQGPNIGSGSGLDWPYSSDPIPGIDGGSTPSISDYEAYLDYLMNNSNTSMTYNGALKALQVLIQLGGDYSKMTPEEQAKFKQIAQNILTGGGNSLFSSMIRMAMMGAFYKNGAAGFSATNAFCTGLAQELQGLAGISPVFSQMAVAAFAESSYVENTAEKNFTTVINGVTYLTDSAGNLMDFEHYVQGATQEIGSEISGSNIQQGINDYYKVEADSLFDQYKNDPGLLLTMLMMLLMGYDMDMSRSVNGYGNQLNNLTAGQNIIQKMLSILQSGSPSAADAKNFMQEITQLMNQVAAYDPSIASTIQAQLQSILGGSVSLKADANGQIASYTATGGIYDFPASGQFPAGVTIYVNGKAVTLNPNSDTKMYIPAGATIELKGTAGTSYNFTLAQLGFSDSIDNNGATDVNYSVGDWGDVAGYLKGNQGLIQALLGVQTTMNSPSSMINTQINTVTSTKSTFEAFMKAGFDTNTNVEQVAMQNSQRAGE